MKSMTFYTWCTIARSHKTCRNISQFTDAEITLNISIRKVIFNNVHVSRSHIANYFIMLITKQLDFTYFEFKFRLIRLVLSF